MELTLTDESIEAVRKEAERLHAETRRHIEELQVQLEEARTRLRGFGNAINACDALQHGDAPLCLAEAMVSVSSHQTASPEAVAHATGQDTPPAQDAMTGRAGR